VLVAGVVVVAMEMFTALFLAVLAVLEVVEVVLGTQVKAPLQEVQILGVEEEEVRMKVQVQAVAVLEL